MKVKLLIALALPAFMLAAGACSKDDEPPVDIDAGNKMVYDGTTYGLDAGVIDDFGYDGMHHNYEFSIFKNVAEGSETVPAFVSINLYSASGEGFREGVFNFMDTSRDDVEGENYFDAGFLTLHLDLSSQTAELFTQVTGGQVKVIGSGKHYQLEFELQLENGKSVTGSYAGEFVFQDDQEILSMNKTMDLLKTAREYAAK